MLYLWEQAKTQWDHPYLNQDYSPGDSLWTQNGLLRKIIPKLEIDKKMAHTSKSYLEHYLTGMLKDYLIP